MTHGLTAFYDVERTMNIKMLTVISVVVLGIGIWFYTGGDETVQPNVLPTPQLNSEITGIRAIQTNPETGEIEYTLSAESLVQDATTGQEVLKNAVIEWTSSTGEHYTLSAASTILAQETGELLLTDGFSLLRSASPEYPEMRIQGGAMTGNLKTRLLASQAPVDVVQAGNQFKAAAMQADLNTGVYEFKQVQMIFATPLRKDQPLF